MKRGTILLALVALAAGGWYVFQAKGEGTRANSKAAVTLADGAIVAVNVPSVLSEQEQVGKRTFDAVCAECHGTNAQGREEIAPPLVHKIYEPGHHGDMAFVLAAQNGVRAHHWRFGNMPAVEGVTKAHVLNIIAYVRALQRENGIN
ncbi:c-type cytochrome [Roseobacter litoralis]|uniref:c-type cytochrome n=1 Tax=Roseobacter litoralis TaxID=42443 RepID=UPI002493A5B4|nr:cytochrome c [Roseobacter litoralis]